MPSIIGWSTHQQLTGVNNLKFRKMKRILYIAMLILLPTLFISCSDNDENTTRSSNEEVLEFVFHTPASNYYSVISEDVKLIRASGLTSNNEIQRVSYRLAEGATIAPLPESISVWKKEQQFEVIKASGERIVYNLHLPDMVEHTSSNYVVMGYISTLYSDFDQIYETINLSHITHLLVSHATVKSDATLVTSGIDEHVDMLVSDAHNAGAKALLVLISYTGTPAEPLSGEFTKAIETPESRAKLINNILTYAEAKGFDGIDLDYEDYADFNLPNIINLAKELREAMPEHWLLTCANGPWLDYTGYAEYLDYINVMSYGEERDGNSPSGQYATMDKFVADIDKTMLWVKDKKKIVGGVPFYGWHWEDAPTVRSFRFDSLIEKFTTAEAADADNMGVWYYNGRNTIREKCRYIKDNGYGGIMIWQLAQDTYNPEFRLLDVIGEEMMDTTTSGE